MSHCTLLAWEGLRGPCAYPRIAWRNIQALHFRVKQRAPVEGKVRCHNGKKKAVENFGPGLLSGRSADKRTVRTPCEVRSSGSRPGVLRLRLCFAFATHNLRSG